MADVKKEVRELGQKITGLKAGDNVTLVLKKPKPKVDATCAKRAAGIADENTDVAREILNMISRAKDMAQSDANGAKKLIKDAQRELGRLKGAVPRAKDWLESAKKDADSAASEVKDGYTAAKDSADIAVQHLEKVGEGLEKAVSAVGAFVE
jgi:hypothetical protein